MMAFTQVLAVVCMLSISFAAAMPADEFYEDGAEEGVTEQGLRFPRVTCDLLSASTPLGSVNHSACAARCLAMRKGFRGGFCNRGVCHCRR